MLNSRSPMRIVDVIHEVTQPPPPGTSRPGSMKRKRYKDVFTTGEMAVMRCLLERDQAPIDNIPSVVALHALVNAKIVTRSPNSQCIGLTSSGRCVANFLIPHL